tara:strand:- start:1265 stop:1948 length:684 start_codon:yes stop_codon:yes gene_type:complete
MISVKSYGQDVYAKFNNQSIQQMNSANQPNIDYVKKFFNTFQNARMYFNFRNGNIPNILCKNKKAYDCKDSYDLNITEGDFFITDLTQERGIPIFEIKIDDYLFYGRANQIIANFDFSHFYEMPKYYESNITDQLFNYVSRTKGEYFYTDNDVVKFFICEDNLLSITNCPNGKRVSDNRFDIRVTSLDNENLIMTIMAPEISVREMKMTYSSFFSLLNGFMIKRERF